MANQRQRCAACTSEMTFFDRAVVMHAHDAEFYRCATCGLIAVPEPSWLEAAYSDPIYTGDTGLLRRCRIQTRLTAAVISCEGLRGGRFLDWAGGYGVFTRMMRDRGHDYYTWDGYADNVLAQGFDGDPTHTYSLVTAFEVFEHLVDPIVELKELAANNDHILLSTQLQPATPPRPAEWWYYQLESGQHIALHTRSSLEMLARRLNYDLLTNGEQYHLFHRRPVRKATRLVLSRQVASLKRIAGGVNRSVGR